MSYFTNPLNTTIAMTSLRTTSQSKIAERGKEGRSVIFIAMSSEQTRMTTVPSKTMCGSSLEHKTQTGMEGSLMFVINGLTGEANVGGRCKGFGAEG